MFVARHSSVGEFRQEHGNESREAPLRSQLVGANSCQPQDVVRDLGGFALEHSTLAQMKGRRGKATQACWDRQANV